MSAAIKLIVGLGNPGSEYQRTRHNAGFDFVEELARQHSQTLTPESKFFGHTARINVNGCDIRLLNPATFMNRSGQAVSAMAQFYKIEPEQILVVHDELDLAPGIARLKHGGGHGGHNGLRDIISCLGNNNKFSRLRLGIGHPGNAQLVVGYVLKKAPAAELDLIDEAIYAATRIVGDIGKGEWSHAMKELHTPK